jgi:hypothetical protein
MNKMKQACKIYVQEDNQNTCEFHTIPLKINNFNSMKTKIIYGIFIIGLLFSLSACDEDYLNEYPQDAMSDETFFEQTSDYKTYVNGLYSNVLRSVSSNRWNSLENGSDNFFNETPSSVLMQQSESGEADETSTTWNNKYTYIRNVNYVLDNKDKIEVREVETDQYIGEAFFIRAWHYFDLLQAFGGVPYIDEVLETDSEELYNTRESRDYIAQKIIDDLDSAIVLLGWKNEDYATAPRINKESALLMKTRVGLYEGSWEYYHGNKGTDFQVEGADGSDFLEQVVDAGDVLMAYQGTSIYKGSTDYEYYDLFNREDYSDVAGAFLYKHYDTGSDVNYTGTRSAICAYYAGITSTAVNDYLLIDGKPESVSDIHFDYTHQDSLIDAKDPRLDQTIYSPDRGAYNEYIDYISAENLTGALYVNLNSSYDGEGGYRIIKGVPYTTETLDLSSQDDIILRYGEALLNYAEAKAILGTISQTDIDNTVNVLRDRVGMPHLSVAEANAWSITYSESDGYDPAGSNVLNEIRRERRVELLLEGFRRDDLKRWAIYEDVINGYKPVGAYYQELEDYWNDYDKVIAAGYSEGEYTTYKLILGSNVDVIGEFVNPYFKNSYFYEEGDGYYINPNRDYLNSIPKQEIAFYEEYGVSLEQNPGWF